MLWYQKYIDDTQWQEFYREEAKRKLGSVISDWENCQAEATARLLVQRLPKIVLKHAGNKDGYVASIYRSILEDIRRELCGRPRPPVLMQKAGPPVPLIFELHCLQGMKAMEISEKIQWPLQDVRHWVIWLVNENKCPERIVLVSTSQQSGDSDYTMSLPASESDDPTADEQTSLELNTLLEMILEQGEPNQDFRDRMTSGSADALKSLSGELNLSDDERLVLRLRFVEGKSRNAAAKQLLMTPGALNSLETALLDRIGRILRNAGFRD